MIKTKFTAKVEKGKLEFQNPTAFYAHLWKFRPEDALEVSVERRRKSRSNQQNAYYWGVVLPVIAHETGHTAEELHEILKRKFLPRKIVQFQGKEWPLPGSTKEQNTTEFSEYVSRCIAEAASMGITIPSPNTI